MAFDDAGIDSLVTEVLDSDEQYVVADLDAFWQQLAVPNPLGELQQRLIALFADRGLVVSFEAHVFVPDEDAELPMHREFEVPAAPAALDLKADTLRALSVQQPWVDLILSGQKNIEYRSRRMREMGPLLLHASGTVVLENFEAIGLEEVPEHLPFRALVGIVDVVDVVPVEGEEQLFEWRLAHPRRFAMPLPYSGAAGIFRVPMSEVKVFLRALAG
jgi:ASCH domain